MMHTDDITYQSLPVLDTNGKSFSDYNELVDYIEQQSVDNLPQMDLPLTHRLTPGLYSREMFAPSGIIITSAIHASEHQFFLMKGKILVMDESGSRVISAPFTGISKAGTRRVGFVLEDIVWTTVHATSLVEDKDYTQEEFIEVIERIENEVLVPRENKFLNTKETI